MAAPELAHAGATPRTEPHHGEGHPAGPSIHARWSKIPGELARLTSARAEAETKTAAVFEARIRRAEEARSAAIQAADARRDAETAEFRALVAKIRSGANSQFQARTATVEAEHQKSRKTALARHRRDVEGAESRFESARWEASAVFETAEKGAQEWRAEHLKLLAAERETLKVLQDATGIILGLYKGYRVPQAAEITPITIDPAEDPFPPLHAAIVAADAALLKLEGLSVAQSFRGPRIAWAFVLPALLLIAPAVFFLGPIVGSILGVIVSGAIGWGVRTLIVRGARTGIARERLPLLQALADAEALATAAKPFIAEVHDRRVAEATARRVAEMDKATADRDRIRENADRTKLEKVREADEKATGQRAEIVEARDKLLRQAAETETRRSAEIAAEHTSATEKALADYRSAIAEAEARRKADWDALANVWKAGIDALSAEIARVRSAVDPRFPDWARANGTPWKPVPGLPPALRIGEVLLKLESFPGGPSKDDRLRAMAPDEFLLPALLDFPDTSSVIVEFSGDEGRKKAIDAMQAVMLRFLTGLPPGKVRFTIIDPVGLGRSFAAFMHLADYSEALVNGHIWTDPQDIDARLAEINSHIETVIQRYLRNEFATIEQYNTQAGEVAEPYRVLVIADFPTGFAESSSKRLAAIAKSGPRCGVYLVLGIDTAQPFPVNTDRRDLEMHSAKLVWHNGKFVLRDPNYQAFPLSLDSPPPGDGFTKLLHAVGTAAREANRVEVPFEVIAPKREDYWKGDSRSLVSVPLGRAGATKLQPMELGKGTSQHVLIAGRTGSGKSTLMHALITNAALIYSPDDIELYLLDFKKGVEFKTYATHRLPHARVIAVESEREFGLSVLQRLDVELKTRGDIYRDLGVQDVAGYRQATGKPMPRILFIVDEFQEFFVEDDKLAQESSLLLDRLVRQGRAFGVHVILGSQTLSGAYSLARSTLGQMAIRVALQCSEADAQLILNEDNAAARNLSRPGEAIYNDSNGSSEGNHIFQVVWLPDARREAYLKTLAEMARQQGFDRKDQIVFEGNKPSDLARHPAFLATRGELATAGGRVAHAWLGEAVAIKDPTAATFRAQGARTS